MSGHPNNLRRTVSPASLRALADDWRREPESAGRNAAIRQLLDIADEIENASEESP